jgi:hypothetical protein
MKMLKQALWVHGTSVQAEREGYFISKARPAWGAEFRTQGSEWFHFAVPTPVIIGGQDSNLQKVFVLYKTQLGAKINMIHVYDGSNLIQQFPNLQYQGDHTQQLDAQNTWAVNPVHIKYGLGISILVDFGQATPNGVPQITFSTAGADFLTP